MKIQIDFNWVFIMFVHDLLCILHLNIKHYYSQGCKSMNGLHLGVVYSGFIQNFYDFLSMRDMK